jgi:hypothetical protein
MTGSKASIDLFQRAAHQLAGKSRALRGADEQGRCQALVRQRQTGCQRRMGTGSAVDAGQFDQAIQQGVVMQQILANPIHAGKRTRTAFRAGVVRCAVLTAIDTVPGLLRVHGLHLGGMLHIRTDSLILDCAGKPGSNVDYTFKVGWRIIPGRREPAAGHTIASDRRPREGACPAAATKPPMPP